MFSKTIGKGVRKREGDTHRKEKVQRKNENRKKQGSHFQHQCGFIECTSC